MPVKSLSAKVPFPDEAPDTVKLKSVSQFGNAEIEKKYPGFGIRLVVDGHPAGGDCAVSIARSGPLEIKCLHRASGSGERK
jgi:hypothetical protein